MSRVALTFYPSCVDIILGFLVTEESLDDESRAVWWREWFDWMRSTPARHALVYSWTVSEGYLWIQQWPRRMWFPFIQPGETYSVSVSALPMQFALFHDCYRINRVKDCWHRSPFAKRWAHMGGSLSSSVLLVSSLRDHSLERRWVNTTNRVTEFVDSGIRTRRRNSLNWENRFFPRESLIRMRHLRIEQSLFDEKSQDLGEKKETNDRSCTPDRRSYTQELLVFSGTRKDRRFAIFWST